MIGFILYLVIVGLIAGFVARAVVPGPDPMSVLATIALGIVGSFIGGFLGYVITHHDANDGAFQASGIIGSIIGAIVALLIYHAGTSASPRCLTFDDVGEQSDGPRAVGRVKNLPTDRPNAAPPARRTVRRGLVLAGRYRLDQQIAVGGMGEVWSATDHVLDRPIAIKVLRADIGDDPTLLRRFRAEARHAAALTHPGVARVYDYGEDAFADSVAFLVMELVDGQPVSVGRGAARCRPPPSSRCSSKRRTRSAQRTPPGSCTAT